jgi:S-ribosylhomocysteine lyase LuxS involved in autoinducer biosynthesis
MMVGYGIALCGAYICWAAEQEEEEIKDAMKDYMKELIKKQKKNQYMIEADKGGKTKKGKKTRRYDEEA